MFTLKNNMLYFFILFFFFIGCKKSANDNEVNEISTKVSTENSKIICDEFDVHWQFRNDTLKLSLSTDLPDYTDIIIRISRSYVLKENSETYSVDYFSENNKVKAWRDERIIHINGNKWRSDFKNDLKQKAAFELGTKAKSIDNNIDVRFVVHARQTNTAFGKWNSQLTGKMVSEETFRIVEKEFHIKSSLDKPISSEIYATASTMRIGNIYIIPKRTPLMSEFDPIDIENAIKNSIWLESGYRIKIVDVVEKRLTPWYKVVAMDINNRLIREGWINSNALIGQTIRQVK